MSTQSWSFFEPEAEYQVVLAACAGTIEPPRAAAPSIAPVPWITVRRDRIDDLRGSYMAFPPNVIDGRKLDLAPLGVK